MVAVASAGNCGIPIEARSEGCEYSNQAQYPAAFGDDLVMSVGSHEQHGIRAPSSSSRPDVDFLAPGRKVESTCFKDQQHTNCEDSGTSFSSPLAAGVVAVLRARQPEASQTQILDAIKTTADCNVFCKVNRDNYGAGLLDPIGAAAELDRIMAASPPEGAASSDLVAAYTQVTGDGVVRAYVARRDGTSIRIDGIEGSALGDSAPVVVVASPDGEYVAATDGPHLTVLRVNQPEFQSTVDCETFCNGVAFRLDNTLVTLTSSPALETYTLGSDGLRSSGSVAINGVGPFIAGQVLAVNTDRAIAYVHLAGEQGGVFAVHLETWESTRLTSAPYDPAAWAVSPDGQYLAVGVQEGCGQPARVTIVDLTASLDSAASEPSTTTIAGPGGINGLHELTSLSFSDTDLVAGWTRPAGQAACTAGDVEADLLRTPIGQVGSAPDDVRVPSWELAVPGVAWEATRGDQYLFIVGDRGGGGELRLSESSEGRQPGSPPPDSNASTPLSPDVPLAVVIPGS